MYAVYARSQEDANKFLRAIPKYIDRSRFTVGTVALVGIKKKRGQGLTYPVQLLTVRLRESKPYCGNHAGPCQIQGPHKPHRKSKCLEGSDWVAFNDMVNDCLDKLGMVCDVEVGGGRFYICLRKDGKRRIDYFGPGGGEFNPFGTYEDRRYEKSGPSSLVAGTPGIETWKAPRKRKAKAA